LGGVGWIVSDILVISSTYAVEGAHGFLKYLPMKLGMTPLASVHLTEAALRTCQTPFPATFLHKQWSKRLSELPMTVCGGVYQLLFSLVGPATDHGLPLAARTPPDSPRAG
jgi:hypothetical protein